VGFFKKNDLYPEKKKLKVNEEDVDAQQKWAQSS